ncbi:MAG TPA: dTMP kinase [Vicinamibacterales bacterium]
MPLIAFEGLDQSGKETQAARLRARLESAGHRVAVLTFPDDETPIGREIRAALAGEREWQPDVMQLLYIANRHERKPRIVSLLEAGAVVICDRYVASSIAYGEAMGLDPAWLADVQRQLPPAALTVLLDISPETALARKRSGRDRYERDLSLLARVRESYRRQAAQPGWALVDGERPRDEVTRAVMDAVQSRLGLP